MLPFLLSTHPYNRRLGDSVQECKCVNVCVRWLIPLPGGKCWLLTSLFYSFHKIQSHRLNWASESHSPVSLTVPLSLFLCICLCLSRSVFIHGKTDCRREKARGLPVEPCGPLWGCTDGTEMQRFLLSKPPLHRIIVRIHCKGILSLESFILFCMSSTVITSQNRTD